jgi:OOP family OmpA-OmpF porin
MYAAVAAGCLALWAVLAEPPPEDYDKDGIPNIEDDCPTDPGVAANQGCPGDPPPPADPEVAPIRETPGLVEVKGSVIALGEPILFETGSAKISMASARLIEALADTISSLPKDRAVIVRGHTDSVGRRAYNLDLSKRRAAAVADALVGRGIERPRLRPDGTGPDVPIADNRTAEGRAKNRRVEFVIVAADAP